MKKIRKFLDKLAEVISYISYAGIIITTLLIVVNVILRRLFNTPIMGVYELVERGMFCLVFASFAYGQSKKRHVHITILIELFPQKLKFLSYALTSFLSSIIAFVLTYASFIQIGYSIKAGTMTSSLFIPLYPFYFIEFITMLVFSLVLLVDSIYSFMAIFNKEYADNIESYWA